MRRRQLAAAGVAGVVLLGGGGVAYAQAQGSAGSYRTTTASIGDVDQTLALSGTVTASTRQDLSFGASGTVTKVAVEAGDTVSAGDVLAKLNPTDLETAVTKARATLAKARAQLETDQTSQASTVTESTTPTASSGDDSSAPSSGSSGSSGGSSKDSSGGSGGTSSKTTAALKAALKKLATQQTAVTSAQTAATDAIAAAKSALSTQADACAVEEAEEPAEPADGEDGDGDDDGGTDTPASTGLSDTCTTALADVQSAQDVVSQKQDTLQAALKDLSTTLTAAVKTVGEAGSTSGSTGSGSGSSSGSGDSGSSEEPAASESSTPAASSGSSGSSSSSSSSGSAAGGSSGGGGTVTAATLAQDQAAIDTAKAELTEAKRALAAAKLTAPFSGEVLSVSAAKGDTVADSDVVVVLAGDGATTVTTTVTLDQIDQVEVGQVAAITPAGATEPASGTVTSIGLLPEGTDTATYPVTIELDGEVAAPEGSTASIQLVIGTATDVVTVPSSAVSTARRTTVTVLTDGEPVVTPVTVGVVGATRTAITEGVKDGQEIVLADLGADLPSGDSTTTSLTGGGGGGGFPGGGAGGGRPTGAGFGGGRG